LAEQVGDALGGLVVVGGVGEPQVAVIENGIAGPVGLLQLVERLGDEKRLEAIPGNEARAVSKNSSLPSDGNSSSRRRRRCL
jgi:hypothetical protein